MLRGILAGVGAGALVVAALVAAPQASAAAAPPAHVPISGSGSSWVANDVSNWSANLRKFGVVVNYAASGSARGRQDFANEQVDFAVSDLTYAQSGEPHPTRAFTYVPLVAGAVGFAYRIQIGGALKTDLRLSGDTLAAIFSGAIDNWNDPAITADNNGRRVARDLPITRVIRSDGSATSYHLTDWFSTRFADRWTPFSDAGATTLFPPADGRTIAVAGSDGVVNQLRQSYRNGAIGYVEPSYAQNAQIPLAAVANASRHFVPPTAGNVSLSLQRRVKVAADGEADLHPLYADPDPRAYPLAYYSYGIVPTGQDLRTTSSKRQTEVDFLGYALCNGQQPAAELGYAPLPLRLTRAGLQAAALIGRADPAVSTRALALSGCANPTFTRAADGSVTDALDGSVAQPPACSAYDAGPCRTTP